MKKDKVRITNATMCANCGCDEYIFTSKSIPYGDNRSVLHKFVYGSCYHVGTPRCYECGSDLRRYA